MSIRKLVDYSQPMVAAVTVLVLGTFVVALYAGYVVRDIKIAQDTVVVTGSAKEAVTADQGRWSLYLETRTGISDQQAGFARLEAATAKITEYLSTQGFTEIELPVPTSYANYTYPQYSEPIMTGYTVSRQIYVRSEDVEKLRTLASDVAPLSGNGYSVSTGMLELTVSTLDEMRVRLLSEAIADAKARAEAIAQDSGRGIDTLRSASSGVVQVLPEGGVEISDYGTYDTQSMNKEVMVTVRATYSLK